MLFLDYTASQDEAVVTYHSSDMVLACHSDASYLSKPGARSRVGGYFLLSNDANMPANNSAVFNITQIIKAVMMLAAEVEIGVINAREAVPQKIMLVNMGHPQLQTRMKADNSAAHSVATNNMQPRRTKAMDI